MIAPGDGWLVERARGGDEPCGRAQGEPFYKAQGEAAFAELVDRYDAAVRSLARAGVANHADAEDVAQETWLDVFRGLNGFDCDQAFGPWIRAVARNRVKKFLRSTTRDRERLVPLDDDVMRRLEAQPAESDPDRREISMAMRRRLEALSARHRMLLKWRYLEDMSLAEAAARCGLSPACAAQTLWRIRQALRQGMRGN